MVSNGGVTVEAIRSGIDLSNVDAGARPQDDLFGHVNGRWLADYEIPADRATDGAFRSLFDRAEDQVRDLITEVSDNASAPGTDEQRIGDLYASFLDEDTVEQRGVQPLLDELAAIDARRRPRRAGRRRRRAATHRRGRWRRRVRRHRLQELHPLPGARHPVRAGAARRVLLPRRAARRDAGRLPAITSRRCSRWSTAAAADEHRQTGGTDRGAGDQTGCRALGCGANAATPTSPTTCAPSPICTAEAAGFDWAGWAGRAGQHTRRRSPNSWCANRIT